MPLPGSGADVALLWKGASTVLTLLRGLLEKWRANQALSKYELARIRQEAESTLSLQRVEALGVIARGCLKQIAETSRELEASRLRPEDEAHGRRILQRLSDELDKEVTRWTRAVGG